jgi:hypothetical protein
MPPRARSTATPPAAVEVVDTPLPNLDQLPVEVDETPEPAPDVTVPSDTPDAPTAPEVPRLDPNEVGYTSCLNAGQDPFEGYDLDALKGALAIALDELHRLNYNPEDAPEYPAAVETKPAGEVCGTCFEGSWDHPFVANSTAATCSHGAWTR